MRGPTLPRWWQRLSLRIKTFVVTAVPMALIVVAIPFLFAAQHDSTRVGQDVEQAYRVRQRLAGVLQGLVDAETGVRGYLLTGDPEFLDTSDGGLASVPHDLQALSELLTAPQEKARFEELERLSADRIAVIERTRAFAARKGAGIIQEGLINEGHRIMDQIRIVIAEMDATESEHLVGARERLRAAERMSFTLSVIVVPLALLLMLWVALRQTSGLLRRIGRIEENARRLERGDELLDPPGGDDELSRLGKVLAHTAERLAEQEAELRELALVDLLTGLPNRRAFLQIAEHELQVAIRRSSVSALLFVDADGLKDVNDRHGHAEGDEMLKELADVLRTVLRSADLIARIGGDEFVVLLSRDSVVDGTEVLHRLEKSAAVRNGEPNRRYVLDFSVGVAFFDPLDPVTVEELIQKADAEMYQQKRAKRLARDANPDGAPSEPSHPVWVAGVDA